MMSSRQDFNKWEFRDALAFAESCKASKYQSTNRKASNDSPERHVHLLASFEFQHALKRVSHLGNFEAVYEGLAEFDRCQSLQKRAKKRNADNPKDITSESKSSDEESSHPDSDLEPLLTPSDQEADLPNDIVQLKEVRWEDDINDSYVYMRRAEREGISDFAARQKYLVELEIYLGSDRLNAHKKGGNTCQIRRRIARSTAYKQTTAEDGESEAVFHLHSTLASKQRTVFVTPQQPATIATNSQGSAPATKLTPAWVTPIMSGTKRSIRSAPREMHFNDASNDTDAANLAREKKMAVITALLARKLGPQNSSSFDPLSSINAGGDHLADEGIHVFVDSSNITIGFYEWIKGAESESLGYFGQNSRKAPFSFQSLAFIMERGRNVAKRILVGSSNGSKARPAYMNEAEFCGYEINLLERVGKFKEHSFKRRSGNGGNSYGASGQSSGSEGGRAARIRFAEQGVDEILHMKMLESMLDYAGKPSTIVLATGDAAEAEFSGGFLLMVRRALVRGWKVELVAWGHSMNHLYRSNEFLRQWKNRFIVIELEDFAELLLGNISLPTHNPEE